MKLMEDSRPVSPLFSSVVNLHSFIVLLLQFPREEFNVFDSALIDPTGMINLVAGIPLGTLKLVSIMLGLDLFKMAY